jgi:hypothetical protein
MYQRIEAEIGTPYCRQRLEGPAGRVAMMATEAVQRVSSAIPLAHPQDERAFDDTLVPQFVAGIAYVVLAIG